MDFASLIIREGDRVTASGRLVRNETGDWFEPPVPVTANFSLSRRVRRAWPGSVRIVDADFGAELTGRFERDGAVEGSATLTGTWAADRLQVERQDLYVPRHRKIPNWTPCVIPSKWTKAELEAVGAHLLAHHDDWNLWAWGDTSTEDGQARITARLTRMLPEIATWAASLPAGILGLEPWLTHAQPSSSA
jgi:hypothetical protein